jgi:thiol:disulfide interchange protein DsbD
VLSAWVLSLVVAAAQAPASTASGALHEGKARVRATLVSDLTQVEPGGAFRLGVHFQMARGWHISWRNPGEVGLPTEVVWDAPAVTVGPLTWPAPAVQRSPDGALTSYGYVGEVVLFATARAGSDPQSPVTVVAKAEVLVCEVQCIPARLELAKEIGVGPRRADPTGAGLLDAAARRVPRPANAAGLRVAIRRTTSFIPGQPFEGELTVERADGSPERLAASDPFVPDRVPGVSVVQGIVEGPGRLRLWGKAAPTAAAAACASARSSSDPEAAAAGSAPSACSRRPSASTPS